MSRLTRYRTIAFATVLVAANLVSAGTYGADPAVPARSKSASVETIASLPHAHREHHVSAAQRPPASSLRLLHRSDYDLPDSAVRLPARPSGAAGLKAACNTAQFAALSGSGLVAAVKAADTDCINGLFGLTGSTAQATFREAQMVSIANALQPAASGYAGSNANSVLQLILFLRAGYYVQYYDPGTVGSYGTTLRSAIRPALDAFAANANFDRVDDAHGEVLAEYMTLLDSAGENARYLTVVKRVLGNYSSSRYAPYYWMKAATNNAFIVVFRGHYDPAFVSLVQSDTSIVDTLYAFANTHFARLGQDDGYLVGQCRPRTWPLPAVFRQPAVARAIAREDAARSQQRHRHDRRALGRDRRNGRLV